MREGVYLCLQIPATLIFTIVEKVLMMIREVEICIRPAIIPTITQVGVVDFWVYMFLLFLFT